MKLLSIHAPEVVVPDPLVVLVDLEPPLLKQQQHYSFKRSRLIKELYRPSLNINNITKESG